MSESLEELKARARESLAAVRANQRRAHRLMLGLPAERDYAPKRATRLATLDRQSRESVYGILRLIQRRCRPRDGYQTTVNAVRFRWDGMKRTWKEIEP
jgi:hypothetical protein